MISTYKKPMITIDAGLAEGIYAASGTKSDALTVEYLSENVYYGENGSKTYRATFSGSLKITSITLTFNQNIGSASANTMCNVSGTSVTLTYNGWAPSSPIDITVVVNSGLSDLKLTGYSYATE